MAWVKKFGSAANSGALTGGGCKWFAYDHHHHLLLQQNPEWFNILLSAYPDCYAPPIRPRDLWRFTIVLWLIDWLSWQLAVQRVK